MPAYTKDFIWYDVYIMKIKNYFIFIKCLYAMCGYGEVRICINITLRRLVWSYIKLKNNLIWEFFESLNLQNNMWSNILNNMKFSVIVGLLTQNQ